MVPSASADSLYFALFLVPILAVALSLREQLLDTEDPEAAVPVTDDDELMDVVVTPDEWISRRRAF